MNVILRAIKAIGVTLGIPLLVIFLAVLAVASVTVVFGWIGGMCLKMLFPFGGC